MIRSESGNLNAAARANARANDPNYWRFKFHNNQWWYYTPQNQWMYYSNNNWQRYAPGTYVAPSYRTSTSNGYYYTADLIVVTGVDPIAAGMGRQARPIATALRRETSDRTLALRRTNLRVCIPERPLTGR